MKKRLIAMLLVLIMAMCIFPISAFAKSPSSLDTMQTRTVDYSFYDYYTGDYGLLYP